MPEKQVEYHRHNCDRGFWGYPDNNAQRKLNLNQLLETYLQEHEGKGAKLENY